MANNTTNRLRYINLYNYLVAVLWIQESEKVISETELMLNYGRLISTAMEVKAKNTDEFMQYFKTRMNQHIDFFNKYNQQRGETDGRNTTKESETEQVSSLP